MATTQVGVYGPSSTGSFTGIGASWSAAPNVGDLNVAVVAGKLYSVAVTPPPGWGSLGYITSGTTAGAADSGSMFMAAHYKERDAASQPSFDNATMTPATNCVGYTNWGFRRTDGPEWRPRATFAADTDASTTSISITFPTTLKFTTGQLGKLVVAAPSDSATGIDNPAGFSIPGCTYTYTQQVTSTTSGNDMRLWVLNFTITDGTATGPATYNSTVSLAQYSTVPAALIQIDQAAAHEHVNARSSIAVASPKAKRNIGYARAVPVTALSPAATVGYNLARTITIAAISPAATKTAVKRWGDLSGELQVDVPTSGVLKALDPATAASMGRADGVEVQIWDPTNTRMLAVVEGRQTMEWLDDMNDVGSGSFTLSPFDPKATEANLALFNIVRFSYAGAVRFASRIETRNMRIVATLDFGGQLWDIRGRGALAMLGDAVLYPEYGINAFTQKQRGFSFASREGPWYVASEWFAPRGMKMADVPDDHPWKGMPEGWPDPEAQWIWPTDPNQVATAGPAWFRSYFTLAAPTTVTVYASADDQVTLYVDGYPTLATVAGENYGFKKHSSYSIRMAPGPHLVAAEVLNQDTSLEEVVPTITSGEVTPSYSGDSNRPYIGRGFTDGGHPYVNGDGSVDGGGPGSAAFDGDANSYWLSVGNYLGWTSAYEWVEGTFPGMKVTAVKVKVRGGPYTVYVSLKNGGNNWNGGATVPYIARAVNAGTAVRYVREIRVEKDQEAVINVDPQDADRIRITLKANWDSGIWQYRWRAAVYNVRVTSENREGSYIRGGNFAGLLVTVATTDSTGAVTGFVHRSQPDGWLAKTGSRPGWLPAHIIIKMLEEAKARNVLGAVPLKLGFTAYTDSRGNPWTMARKDVSYGTGDDYISILRQLTEDSDMDVWIDAEDLVVHAAPKRGQDRTSDVVLRPGQSLRDLAVQSDRPMGTRMVVESKYGWTEVGDFLAETGIGRVEGFVSLGNALSLEEARLTTVRELSRFAMPSYDVTVADVDTIGPRPYIDYGIGDLVTLPTGFQQQTDAYRVLSFRISEGDAGDLKVSVETDREPYALTGPAGAGTGSGSQDDNGIPAGAVLAKISTAAVPYAGDVRTATTYTANTDGAVYDRYDFDRLVVVNASGVVFTNCLFSAPGASAPPGEALLATNPSKSATADHCTLIPVAGAVGLIGAKGGGLDLVRCEISMLTKGVLANANGVTVDNCWLHDMQEYSGGGAFGVAVTGGSGIDVVGTRIDGFVDDAAVWVSQEGVEGAPAVIVSDVKVRDCILGSDSQVGVYVYDGSATFEPPISGLQITGNLFEKGRQETAMSVSSRTLATGTTAVSDNIWSDGSVPPPHAVTGP